MLDFQYNVFYFILQETFRIPRREKKNEKEEHCENSLESNTAPNRKAEIKNRNIKYSTKGNFEESMHLLKNILIS